MRKSALLGPPKQSAVEIETASRELARNAIVMQPELPSGRLVSEMVNEAGAELLENIAGLLVSRYFVRLINSERARAGLKLRSSHPLFPDLDLLPDRVTLPDGRRPRTAKLNLTQVRARIKLLKEKLDTRIGIRTRKELEQWEALAVRMEIHAAQSRGITAAEVAALEG